MKRFAFDESLDCFTLLMLVMLQQESVASQRCVVAGEGTSGTKRLASLRAPRVRSDPLASPPHRVVRDAKLPPDSCEFMKEAHDRCDLF